MLTILITLLPIFLLILVGVLAERFRLVPLGTGPIINQFVLNLSLPSMIFGVLISRSASELNQFQYMAGVTLAPLICYLILFFLFTKLLRKPVSEGCMAGFLCCFPNALFLGLPVLLLLFPNNDEVVLGSSIAAILTIPFMLLSMIILDVQREGGQVSARMIFKKTIRFLLYNPLIWAFVIGTLICIIAIPIPQALITTFKLLGSTSSPCALVALGMAFGVQLRSWQAIKINIGLQVLVTSIKIVLVPTLTGLILVWLGVDNLWVCTGVIIMGTPTGTLAYAISEEYQVNVQDSAFAILANTTISIFSLPAIVMVLRVLGYC